MAQNKKDEFDSRDLELAELAKALAHPARIAIIRKLAECNSCICGEIVEDLPLAQSTVSQHLKALKQAGLIIGELDGPKSCYCINWKVFDAFTAMFNRFYNKSKSQSCC